MSDEYDIEDDGFDSFDDFDAPDFDGDVGGGSKDRTPITVAATSFTEAATSNLLSVNAAKRIARKGLPEGYSEAADLVDDVAFEASDLYDKAEKRLEPAIKSAKEATRGLLPKAEGILPKGVYEKISSWSEDDSRRGSNVNADEESISTALSSIFTTQMEEQEKDRQEQIVQGAFKDQVENQRHEQSVDKLSLIQQSMSRLVGYQDSITATYQKKSLDLQFRNYFAARDLLKLQTASNTDVITALNDIKTNTGLPDWVKTQNSENFQSMLQERLMGGTVDNVSDYMQSFRTNLISGVKDKVMETVGEVADGISEISGGITQLNEASEMMGGMEDGPKDSGATKAAGFAGDAAGGAISNKIIGMAGKALQKETGASKYIVEKGLAASNMVRGADGKLKEFIDTADDRDGIAGMFGRFLKEAAPTLNTRPEVLQNLSKDATASVQWDVLSRRTLIEIIPEYLARITQNTESMATGQPAEKMVFSKLSERFVTEGEAVAEATDKFVKRSEITDYQERNQKLLNKIFGDAKISEEARAVMSEQIHTDLDRGWNIDPRRYVETGAFENRFDRDAVGELQEFFRDKFKAKDVGEMGKEDWEFDLSEQNLKQIGNIFNEGKNLQQVIPNMQGAINEFVGTGDKDLLRSTGWIDDTSGKDQFNLERMNGLLTGRLSLDDLQSEWDRYSLKEERKENSTKWREQDRGEWQLGDQPQTPTVERTRSVEQSVTPMAGKDLDIVSQLTKVLNQHADNSKGSLDKLSLLVSTGTEAQTLTSQQVGLLTEIRDILAAQQVNGLSAEESAMGAELLKKLGAGASIDQPSMMGNLSSKVMGAGKAGIDMLGSYYGMLGNAAGSALNFAKEKGSAALGYLGAKKDTVDVFIAGIKKPALRADFIKAGRYVDVATGNVITNLKDITGAVKDLSTGNLVITEEDYENGIFDGSGESLISRLGTGARDLVSGGVDMLGGYYGFLFKGASSIIGGVKERAIGLDRKLKNQVDVYVKSRMEDGPALLRTKLLRGAYFDKDGNSIFSIGDIDGPVYDEEGNMVLTDEDISAGLVDPQGEEIQIAGLFGNGVGIIGSGIGLAKTAGSKVWEALKGYYSGIGKAGKSLLDRFKGGIPSMGGGDVDVMNISANTVYLNGNIQQSPAEAAGTAVPTVNEKVSDIGEQLKGTATNIKDRATEEISVAASKAKDVADKAVDKVKSVDTTKAEETIKDVKNKATDKLAQAKDKLLGKELGEDTVLVGDADGNVSIKTENNTIPAGDGSTKGYMAALLAYFYGKDDRELNDTDGDGFRDGGWRSKLFGKEEEEDGTDKSDGQSETKPKGKGMLAGLAGALGFGGDDDGDGGSLAGDIASEAAGEVIGDKISGNGKDEDGGRRRRKGPKVKPKGRMGRAWQAIKGVGSGVKKLATSGKGLGLLGGTAATISTAGGMLSGAGGSVATKMAATSGLKKAALWGLKGALGLAGGILAAPAVGTALAIAGAAYTAYEVFSFFSNREGTEPLEEYRFRQYGLDPEDSSHRSFIRQLEDEAIDHVNYRGQEGTENSLDLPEDFHEDILELLNIDLSVPYEEDPENSRRASAYGQWFNNRFMPVFLLHHGISRMLDDGVDLLDIDDELDDSKKFKFAKEAYYPNDGTGRSPYSIPASMMEDFEPDVGYEKIDEMRKGLMEEHKEDAEGEEKTKEEGSSFLSKLGTAALAVTPVGAALALKKVISDKPKTEDKVAEVVEGDGGKEVVTERKRVDYDAIKAKALSRMSDKTRQYIEGKTEERSAKAGTEAVTKPPISTATAVKRKLKTSKVSGKSGFIMPTDGRITSNFGKNTNSDTGEVTFNSGIDIVAPKGTEVLATQGGVITRRGYSRNDGNVIYIDNDDGTHSRYANLDKFEAGYTVGDRVEQGAKIAEVGDTGWVTSPRLHFEVRKNAYDKKSAINPLDLFKGSVGTKAKEQVAAAIKESKEQVKVSKTHDQKRENVSRMTTPLVKPSLMVPTQVGTNTKPSYTEDTIAVADTDTVVATPKSKLNMAPASPIRKGTKEDSVVVEGEVIQQRRAQLSQENANVRSEKQLEAIGMLMSEQLKTQQRMVDVLQEVATNTKATAEGVHKQPQSATIEGEATQVKKPVQPNLSVKQLSGLMNQGKSKSVSYPLLMGRNK